MLTKKQILSRVEEKAKKLRSKRKYYNFFYPAALEQKYRNYLLLLIKKLFGLLSSSEFVQSVNRLTTFSDKNPSDPEDVLRALRVGFTDDDIKRALKAYGARIDKWTKQQLEENIKVIAGISKVKYSQNIERRLVEFTKDNVGLIKSIQKKAHSAVERLILQSSREGKTNTAIKKELMKEYGLARNKAILIARDQTGKLNGDLAKLRQKEVGGQLYWWRAVTNDSRTRESHAVLSGKLCDWNDNTVYYENFEDALNNRPKTRNSIGGYIGIPGEDYQCRCTSEMCIEQVLYDIEKSKPNYTIPNPILSRQSRKTLSNI